MTSEWSASFWIWGGGGATSESGASAPCPNVEPPLHVSEPSDFSELPKYCVEKEWQITFFCIFGETVGYSV